MGRFRNKSRKPFVKPIGGKAPTVDHVTGDKIPKSFVFSRGKLPGPLKQLQMDLRKLMLPYTALKLKETKRNILRDFVTLASGMHVTHFLILSKTDSAPYLRVALMKHGPTLTFKIHKYSLAADIAQSQLRPRCPLELFKTPPLIVLSGFGTGEQHLKLTTNIFQTIFPAIDINTVKLSSCQRIVLLNYDKETKLIDFRHYSIRLQPVGVSRRIRKFVQNHQVPDLRSLQDVSDFLTKYVSMSLSHGFKPWKQPLVEMQGKAAYNRSLWPGPFSDPAHSRSFSAPVALYIAVCACYPSGIRAGYGSESEADDEAATVNLSSDIGRVNRASTKSAVKLQEIGPRMTLQLVKIEQGLCAGDVLFNEYGNVNAKKSENEEENEQESDEEMDRDEQEDEEEQEQETETS
ncbi:Peter Pan-like protein [Capsicum annuum]|nr:Peter Pan-like protein [Capsicum annuum]